MSITAAIGTSAAGLPNAGDQANAVLSGIITGIGPTAPFAFRGPMNLAIWASINTALTTTKGSLAATVGSAAGLAVGAAINSVNLPRGSTIGTLVGTNVTLALAPRTYWGVFNPNNGQVTGNFPTDRVVGATATIPSNAEGVTLPAGTTVTSVVQQNVAASTNSAGVPGIIQLSANPTAVPTDPNPRPFQLQLTGNGVVATGADAAAIFTGSGIQWSGTVQLERSFDGGLTYIPCNLGTGGSVALWTAGPISFTFGEPEKQTLYRFNCTAFTANGTSLNYRISQTGGAAESLAIGPLI